MNYTEAIRFVEHEIYKKRREIDNLKECVAYLENESNSKDELTQSPEKILKNFGYESIA